EAPSSEIGERTFKGIPYSIRIYKVINDPGSDLAVTLAKGIKLSDKGPIIEGIRDQLASRQNMMLKKVLGGLALLAVAIVIWLTLVPSTVEKATSKADKLLEDGQNLAVITLMEPLLAEDPTNKALQAKATEAAMRHIDVLMKENRQREARTWIKETVLRKPYLAKINEKKPLIDTKITINKLLSEGDNGYQKPKEIRDLLTRYPDSFEAPYTAATMLENKWWSITVLWLYKTALERGGYHGDEKIYNFCTSRLEGGEINWNKFDYAVEILDKYYPKKLQEWAKSGSTSPNVMATINALDVLKNKKDPLLDDPYFDHLRNLVYGRNTDLEKDFTTFRKQSDPARRQQLLALHREIIETYPRFTSFGIVKDTLKVNLAKLEKEWGIAK
ncbi:MAG: hypothetical protein KAV87_40705, partial [Desulfobacteraceae bacterium]|nr:hypothetical protein [Desulfobacteraceae bacterium]